MNVDRMHLEFDITVDKLSSETYQEIYPQEKDYYLNEAQSRFLKVRYGGNNLYRTSFEQSQKRTDDLKNLVVSRYAITAPVDYYPFHASRVNLDMLYKDEDLEIESADIYTFYIKSMVRTCNSDQTCCKYHGVKQVQQDDITKILKDPFNKPTNYNPILFFEDGDVFVSAGDTYPDSVFITFIRKPLDISLGYGEDPEQQCELSEHTHKEIVQMAAKICIENIESQRIQTQQLNINESE